jgi:hypothetical protein
MRARKKLRERDVGAELAGNCRARDEPAPQCASPVCAAFDPCPRAKRSIDPIRVATATPPRRAAIADVPAIDDNAGDAVDQLVDVTHEMPIGIACREH